MLTCFQGSTDVIFQKILKFFVKQNSIVLDLTYGEGLSWNNLKENYTVIKVDKRKLSKDIIKTDFNTYLKKKESDSVDCIYFDPPYYFKEKIKQFNIEKQMLNHEDEVFWTEKEFKKAIETLQKEVPRVLRTNGIFIVKIMDGYVGKEYYSNAFNIFDVMHKSMKPKGTFVSPIQRKSTILKLIRVNHIYYLVFEK